MSLTTLESLKLGSISPNRFPVVGTDGVLTDGRIQRVYSNAVLIHGDNSGAGSAAQISSIQVLGWMVTEPSNSRLYLDVTYDNGVRFITLRKEPHPSVEILAQASWETSPVLPGRITLKSHGLSGVSAVIELASEVNDSEIQLAFPFSPTVAAMAGNGDNVIDSVVLHGVTRENSDLGRLSWRYEQQGSEYHFTVSNGVGAVARAVLPVSASLPDEFELEPLFYSGVYGTVTLTGYDADCEGGLVVNVLQGILIDTDAIIEGDLDVGASMSVIGNLSSGGDLSASGSITVAALAGNEYTRYPIAIDADGTLVRDNLRIQQVFAQCQKSGGLNPDGGQIPLLNAEQPNCVQRGITFLPEAWWGDGKRFTFRAAFRWERDSLGTDLDFTMFLESENDTINLFSTALPETGSDLSGAGILDIDLIVTRLQYETETLELRGFYRFNDSCGHIAVKDYPVTGYTLAAKAVYSGDDNDNLFMLDSASLIAYERPRALEA